MISRSFMTKPVSKIMVLLLMLSALLPFAAKPASAAGEPYSAYLISYFKGSNSQVYLAYSTDALHWTPLNSDQPIVVSTIGSKQIRDPFIIRGEDNVFHLLGTDNWSSRAIVVYDSTDLIHWNNQRLVTVAPSSSTFAWAPEAIYDAAIGKYRIYFATNPGGGEHKMYQVTTSDFINVSSPTAYYDPGSGKYAIDGDIHSSNGINYMFFKYSDPGPTGKGIQRVQSTSLAGPWTNLSGPLTDLDVEGPIVVPLINQNKWYMYYDYYQDGHFGASVSTNLGGSWTKLSSGDISLPSDIRHASVIPINSNELNNLKQAFGTGSYIQLRNRASGLYLDGMGRTSNGDDVGQWTGSGSYNQQWTIEADGSYVRIKNRYSGLYVDGMGRSSNGSTAGQWGGSNSYNQQWAEITVGNYVKFQNRATGLYLDGMGRSSNGDDVGQWGSSGSYNQQWQIVNP